MSPIRERLILDLMGGDRGSATLLEGAAQALPHLDCQLTLVGDEKLVKGLLAKRKHRVMAAALERGAVDFVHSSETIEMVDSIRAIRSKPGASINIGCKMAAEAWKTRKKGGEAPTTGFISAGHSGAMMASALLNMGRIGGIDRPAIAAQLPSLSEGGAIWLDVGANVDCKPEHLRDFALMGALYAQAILKRPGLPRLGVLNNGEERTKGNDLTQKALALIESMKCFQPGPSAIAQLKGFCEGKEVFKGQIDVVVADGFVGNVVLKSIEGLGAAIVTILKRETKANPLNALGFLVASQALTSLYRKLDYAETGTAPLLGVAGYAFICHGRSNAKAIKNALMRAQAAVKSRFLERLEVAIQEASGESA